MDGAASYNPRTVEEVFRDFKGRRAGVVKALTTDVEEFFQQCDPEKENLCLYGFYIYIDLQFSDSLSLQLRTLFPKQYQPELSLAGGVC
uniref:PHD finger protein ALFIN-LIKE n=1 Tax=Rhizophora mucronata TaxID=61149 RepID=A0A2P2IJN8_RHIMU